MYIEILINLIHSSSLEGLEQTTMEHEHHIISSYSSIQRLQHSYFTRSASVQCCAVQYQVVEHRFLNLSSHFIFMNDLH
jgi:hypothetical protein